MSLRVLALGMLGAFSAIPLERMLGTGTDVIGVVVPAAAAPAEPIRVLDLPPAVQADFVLQAAAQRNVVQLARDHAIPVLEAGAMRHPQTVSLLRALAPDLIVAACFPFILPRSVLRIPAHGCWNLHPSLLPKMRGPSPLFWVFHEGCAAGVTLHVMSARADAGPIIAQKALEFPDGIAYAEAEHACAQWGARLLVDALRALEWGRLSTRAQDERVASYFPAPRDEDFVLTPSWPARRAFNFIRGATAPGQARIEAGSERFRVREALGYQAGAVLDGAYQLAGDELTVQCAGGVLRVRVDLR